MGKSLPQKITLNQVKDTAIAGSKLINNKNPVKPIPSNRRTIGESDKRIESSTLEEETAAAAAATSYGRDHRSMRLSDVVAHCAKRWFKDTLKEAKAGDIGMQALVGQMYQRGYGTTKDPRKGMFWISRASSIRSSIWKVSNKQPGYNASDSDSDEKKDDGTK